MTILEAMASPMLFGSSFAGPEWDAWRAFLGALYGLPMDEAMLALYRACSRNWSSGGRARRSSW